MRLTVVALAALTVLAACGGRPVADPPPTHSTAPSVSSSPAPPVMPALAKQHTEAGAKAFIEYVWRVVDYSMASLRSDLLVPLMSTECVGCRRGIEFIENVRASGGSVEGGTDAVSQLTVMTQRTPSMTTMRVSFAVTNTAQVVRIPGKRPKTYPASTTRLAWMLDPEPAGWIVADWQVAS